MIRFLALALSAALLFTAAPAFGVQRVQSVSFADANFGVMSGGYSVGQGFISTTQDGGASWSATRFSNRWMFGAQARPGGTAVAVSDYADRVYRTTNFGGSWGTGGAVIGAGSVLKDVVTLNGGRIVAIGYDGSTGGYGQLAAIASSIDNGASFDEDFQGPKYVTVVSPEITEPKPALASMVDIAAAPSGQVAWALANEWNQGSGDVGSTPTLKRGLIYKTTNAGSSWATGTVTYPVNGTPPNETAFPSFAFRTAVAPDDTHALAAGNYWYVARTDNGGSTWTGASVVPSPMPPTWGTPRPDRGFNALAAVDANTIVAVGDLGWIAKTANGGVSWTALQMPNQKRLTGVAIITPTTWIAVGDDETIYKTTNAGVSWAGVSTAINPPTVSQTTPAANFPLSTSPVLVSGSSADAGVGVANVDVRIRRADGKYFNGSTWVTGETWLPASSSDGWKTWSRTWTPTQETVSVGQAWIKARAIDGMGNVTQSAEVASVNTRQPTTFSGLWGNRTGFAYGTTTQLAASLQTVAGAAPGPQLVYLQRSSNGTSGWLNVASKTTGPSGYVKFDIPANSSGYNYSKAYFRFKFYGAAGLNEKESAARYVDPKAYMGAPWSSKSTVYAKKTYSWYATLKPRHYAGAGAVKLQFQRKVGTKYKAYKTVTAYAYNYSTWSRVKGSYKIPYKGKWRVRAYHDDAGHWPTYSGWTYKTVK